MIIFIIKFFKLIYYVSCNLSFGQNIILRRKEMYSIIFEVSMALSAISLAYFIKEYFLKKEEILFITVDELREELWIVILIVLYQFFVYRIHFFTS